MYFMRPTKCNSLANSIENHTREQKQLNNYNSIYLFLDLDRLFIIVHEWSVSLHLSSSSYFSISICRIA